MARSLICHISMWALSGVSETKSQKVSWADWAWGNSLLASGFTAWIRSGNLMASWMKNTGMLLPIMSHTPCSV